MGVRVKGSVYCTRCKQPVLAQKTGHGVRNTIAIGGVLNTLGLSLLVAKKEKWRCSNCGGSVKPLGRAQRSRPRRSKTQWRCEKHGHLLDQKRTTCPIDGSAGGWRSTE
jgi:hypothetical protein